MCFLTASQWIPSGLVAVVFSTATLWNALNARIFFGQKIAANVLGGGALGLLGLGLLIVLAYLALFIVSAVLLFLCKIPVLGTLLLAVLIPIEVLWLRWMRRKVEREVRQLRETLLTVADAATAHRLLAEWPAHA